MTKELTDMQLMQGSATLLIEKMLLDTGSTQGSMTIGLQKKKDAVDYKYFRIIINEIPESEVEHYQKAAA